MKTLSSTITEQTACVKRTMCNHRHICDGAGSIMYGGEKVQDCPRYISRKDAYTIKLVERDLR